MLYDAFGRRIAAAPLTERGAKRKDRFLASARDARLRALTQEMQSLQQRTPVALMPQDMILTLAYWMYYTSGLYGGMIEKATDVMVGAGYEWKADDEQVQIAIRRFWRDRINNFPWWHDVYVAELGAFGEQCFTMWRKKSTNRIRTGRLMPWNIERTITDPGNDQVVIGVKPKTQENIIYKTIFAPNGAAWEHEFFSPKAQEMRKGFVNPFASEGMEGVLYYAVNPRLADDGVEPYGPQLRGTPDLFANTDMVIDAEEILHESCERARLANRILYSVKLTGAGPKEIEEFVEATPIPDAYTLVAHNENEEWTSQAPQLQASNNDVLYRMVRNAAISGKGAGQPPTWHADGEVYKTSAAEMPFSSIKRLARRQQKSAEMFVDMIGLQLCAKGLLTAEQWVERDMDAVFDVDLPIISEKDAEKLAHIHSALVSSLSVGTRERWIDADESAQVYRSSLQDLSNTELKDWQTRAAGEDLLTEDYVMSTKRGRLGRDAGTI